MKCLANNMALKAKREGGMIMNKHMVSQQGIEAIQRITETMKGRKLVWTGFL